MRTNTRIRNHFLVAAAAMLVAAPAWAQDKVTLKFADWMPLSHYTIANAAKPFIEKVKELSNGSLEIQFFPAEQLGKAKDALTLVQTGVADIADISPAYIPEKFSLSSVAELPAMFTTACEGSEALAALAEDGGFLEKTEFAPNKIRVLTAITYAPYKVLTVGREVKTVEDFAGLKLRTAGGAMDMTADTLGAVSVRMPGPDILPSLSRGTLDGTLAPLQSVKVFDLQTVLKHMTTDVSLASFVTVYAISDRAWQSLSPEHQKVLTEAGKFASQTHCSYVEAEEPKVIEELTADGVVPNKMAPGQRDALHEKLSHVKEEWAKTLDDLGRPGSEALKAFTEQVSAK